MGTCRKQQISIDAGIGYVHLCVYMLCACLSLSPFVCLCESMLKQALLMQSYACMCMYVCVCLYVCV
jgi:hypothetical protein